MAGLVSSLIDVLQGQVDLYNQIAALSARKKEFVIANDIDSLRDILAEENAVIPKVIRGDKDREKIMKDICTVLNKKEAELTLRGLVVLMENRPEHVELAAVVTALGAAAAEVQRLNEDNKALVEQALEFIDYNINVIHSSMAEAPNMDLDTSQSGFLDING